MIRNKNVLKSLARLLREADEEPQKEEGEDSLDAQIDKYLSQYESEAKSSKNEGLDFRSMTRGFLLKEEGEDDSETESNSENEEETQLTEEDIDIQSFSSSIVRLIDNYDSLLEVRNTILRRATNFLAKNYSQGVVDIFKEELLETHDIEIGKSDSEKEDEFEPPKAGAAGPMGGGAGGA